MSRGNIERPSLHVVSASSWRPRRIMAKTSRDKKDKAPIEGCPMSHNHYPHLSICAMSPFILSPFILLLVARPPDDFVAGAFLCLPIASTTDCAQKTD